MKQLILSICMGGLLFASSGCSRLLYGQWKVHQEADPLDDSPIVIIRLLAENKVGLTRPELMVRCEEGFTDVFIRSGPKTPGSVPCVKKKRQIESVSPYEKRSMRRHLTTLDATRR